MKKSPTFLLMTLNFNIIYLYLLINYIFSNSGKIVSKSETGLFSVSKQNPTSLETFQSLWTEKTSKFKGFRGSVYSLEPENLSNVIGLRKKQDTPKVVYFTLGTSRQGVHIRVPPGPEYWLEKVKATSGHNDQKRLTMLAWDFWSS